MSEFEKSFFGQEGRPDVKIQGKMSKETIDDASRLLDDQEESDIQESLRIAEEPSKDLIHPDNEILNIGEDSNIYGKKGDNQVPPVDLEL